MTENPKHIPPEAFQRTPDSDSATRRPSRKKQQVVFEPGIRQQAPRQTAAENRSARTERIIRAKLREQSAKDARTPGQTLTFFVTKYGTSRDTLQLALEQTNLSRQKKRAILDRQFPPPMQREESDPPDSQAVIQQLEATVVEIYKGNPTLSDEEIAALVGQRLELSNVRTAIIGTILRSNKLRGNKVTKTRPSTTEILAEQRWQRTQVILRTKPNISPMQLAAEINFPRPYGRGFSLFQT